MFVRANKLSTENRTLLWRFTMSLWGVYCLMGCSLSAKPSLHQTHHDRSADPGVPHYTVPPMYPIHAARDGVEGTVCFLFDLSDGGEPMRLRVTESQPEGVFDAVSLAAFSQWRFTVQGNDGAPLARNDRRYCLDFKLQ